MLQRYSFRVMPLVVQWRNQQISFSVVHNQCNFLKIHFIQSTEDPGGVGEIGLPTVAPAWCNALAAAGYRARKLPLKNEGFMWV